MSQRTIRFKDDVEAEIEARAKSEGRSFAGWVKRAVEKALGNGASSDDAPVLPPERSPAPPRPPRKTTGQRTPPRPQKREAQLARSKAVAEGMVASKAEAVLEGGDPAPETPPGCADCGGDIAVHPEFGRYCTGCGARVR